jgi:pyruvate dehydrogenase E2 component (dihydrolipoamide acetyltransferase)
VRRLARELGVDLEAVQGSGILGRISAEDVRAYAEGGAPRAAAPAAPAAAPQAAPLPDFSAWGETERVAMSGIRKATVRSMTTAWTTVPMVTHFDKADATEFEALRQRHKADA